MSLSAIPRVVLRRAARSTYSHVPPNARAASTTATLPAHSSSRNVRTIAGLTAFVVGSTILGVYYFDSRSALHRYAVMPIIRLAMDPETGHKFAVKVLGSGLAPRDIEKDSPALRVELWGRQILDPVGLAAGFDKNGEAIEGLFNLGFSWVEVGSVTPKPQEGNPQPRVFHLPEDSAIINRYGFPSQGHAVVLSRLRSHFSKNPPMASNPTILAINLGKNKSSPPDSTSDFISGVQKFGPLADVLVINVSSPNTPGLRGMQGRGVLEELLTEVVRERDALPDRSKEEWKWSKPKVVVKIAPDLNETEVEDVAEAVRTTGVDGVIVSNTTVQRPSELQSLNSTEVGGLSGPPLHALSLRTLHTLRSHLPASTPIIGCGGVSSGNDALDFATAGATLVQLYTAFSYDGPGCVRRVKDEIALNLMEKNLTWNDVVKKSVEELSWKQKAPEQILQDQAEQIKKALGGRVEQGKDQVKLQVADVREGVAKRVAEGETSLQALIREAETALGISQEPSHA